eukprot:scaffold10685_cov77-Cylindrotheca_fusiformis.AAC.3
MVASPSHFPFVGGHKKPMMPVSKRAGTGEISVRQIYSRAMPFSFVRAEQPAAEVSGPPQPSQALGRFPFCVVHCHFSDSLVVDPSFIAATLSSLLKLLIYMFGTKDSFESTIKFNSTENGLRYHFPSTTLRLLTKVACVAMEPKGSPSALCIIMVRLDWTSDSF